MKPGIYFDIPNEAYHAGPGESSSDVVAAGISLMEYRHRKLNKKEPTPAMELGTATHSAILEPELFEKQYTVVPENAPKRPTDAQRKAKKPSNETVAAIKWWDEFEAANAGRKVLSRSELDQVLGMRDAVIAHPLAEYVTMGVPEASVYAIDPDSGLLVKCRPDNLIAEAGLCTNLKTCTDASERGFINSIKDFQYDWASAFYCDVLKLHFGSDFDEVHFLVEKEAPYHIGVYSLSPESLDYARAQYREALRRIARAKQTDRFPGYAANLKVLTLPNWAQKQIEGDIV